MELDFFKVHSCNDTLTMCPSFEMNMSDIISGGLEPSAEIPIVGFSNRFYAYFTPIIIVIGIAGNMLSLCVLLS